MTKIGNGTSPRAKLVAAVALAIAVTIGVWVIGEQCLTCIERTDDPEIECPATVHAGAKLEGSAWSPNPPIKVTAKVDGQNLEGSPDWGTLNELNPFSFPVPEGLEPNTVIEVTATNGCGDVTTVYVRVI
jgi:hypothetical protein